MDFIKRELKITRKFFIHLLEYTPLRPIEEPLLKGLTNRELISRETDGILKLFYSYRVDSTADPLRDLKTISKAVGRKESGCSRKIEVGGEKHGT